MANVVKYGCQISALTSALRN